MRLRILCSLIIALAVASMPACNRCSPDQIARGSASISWSITDRLEFIATCARVGATSVSLALQRRGGTEETRFDFPCLDSQATTPPVTAGPYDATLTLRAADGSAIAVGPTQANVTIGADQVTTLAPVVFAAVAGGKLIVSLSTVTTTGNCTSKAQGGAGTTAHTITLVNAGGGCAAVTFTRLRGTTPLGEYQVNCSSPQIATCIERDETLVADGLRSGPYVITVFALVGASRCSSEVEVLSIPAGATLVKPIQLPPNDGAGC